MGNSADDIIVIEIVRIMHHLRYALYNNSLLLKWRSCSIKKIISRKLTRLIRGRKGAGAEPIAFIELYIVPVYN